MNNQHADLDAAWDEYRKMVVPSGAGLNQIEETRRSFYAGAAVIMGFFYDMANDDNIPPLEGSAAVASLNDQVERFLTTIGEPDA